MWKWKFYTWIVWEKNINFTLTRAGLVKTFWLCHSQWEHGRSSHIWSKIWKISDESSVSLSESSVSLSESSVSLPESSVSLSEPFDEYIVWVVCFSVSYLALQAAQTVFLATLSWALITMGQFGPGQNRKLGWHLKWEYFDWRLFTADVSQYLT